MPWKLPEHDENSITKVTDVLYSVMQKLQQAFPAAFEPDISEEVMAIRKLLMKRNLGVAQTPFVGRILLGGAIAFLEEHVLGVSTPPNCDGCNQLITMGSGLTSAGLLCPTCLNKFIAEHGGTNDAAPTSE